MALAGLVGTTGQQISHLELGKRHLTVEWLEKLAAALGCHPWEIVGDGTKLADRESQLLAVFRLMTEYDQAALLNEASAKLEKAGLAKVRSA